MRTSNCIRGFAASAVALALVSIGATASADQTVVVGDESDGGSSGPNPFLFNSGLITTGLSYTPALVVPERKHLMPLPDRHVEAYYDLIAGGAFASPATVSNEQEDFAESLATFMHTIIRGRPWELEVHRDGKLVRKLRTCWTEPRCSRKREILELLLERWSHD